MKGKRGSGTDPAHLKAIFNLSPDGLMICDNKGVILDLNETAERLNGFRAEEIIGKDVKVQVKKGYIDRSATQEVIETKRQVSIIQYVPNSGYTLLTTGTPVLGDDGKLLFVVVNQRDISLLNSMRNELTQARKESDRAKDELTELNMLELKESNIIAESDAMKQTLKAALKLSRLTVSNILIQGESGTGKGLLAKFIHNKSGRSKKSFIQINCAALPENLLEAELFGYTKGAFTGANEKGKPGLFEIASGGTLFLDEIGEMPLHIQAKLLKYLDDQQVMPIGGTKPKKIDCTLIAATNRDIESLTARKKFRLDLFHRLNTFTLKIPPLRERPEDILELVTHFLKKYNKKYDRKGRISHEAFEKIQAYAFPGNVRELINIIKKAVVMSDDRLLDKFILGSVSKAAGYPHRRSQDRVFTLSEKISTVEREILREALEKCRTTRQAASFLGISQSTAVRKFRKYGFSTLNTAH